MIGDDEIRSAKQAGKLECHWNNSIADKENVPDIFLQIRYSILI